MPDWEDFKELVSNAYEDDNRATRVDAVREIFEKLDESMNEQWKHFFDRKTSIPSVSEI